MHAASHKAAIALKFSISAPSDVSGGRDALTVAFLDQMGRNTLAERPLTGPERPWHWQERRCPCGNPAPEPEKRVL